MLNKRSGKNFFNTHISSLRFLIIAVSLFVSIVTISAKEPFVYRPKYPQYDNLKYGVPGPADTIIEREGYALGYIEKHEQPSWVCYIVTKDELKKFFLAPLITQASIHVNTSGVFKGFYKITKVIKAAGICNVRDGFVC